MISDYIVNNNALSLDDTSCQIQQLKILLNGDMETATVQCMFTLAKRNFVERHHSREIFQIQPCKSWKNGGFRTYVYDGTKRIGKTAATREKLFEKLYVFYLSKENKSKTLDEVFEMFMDYKLNELGVKEKTVKDYRWAFGYVSEALLNENINNVTESVIRRYLVSDLLTKKPKKGLFKRILQLIKATFNFGIKNKLCYENHAQFIEPKTYYKYCDLKVKANEAKAFSDDELARLEKDSEDKLDNPRVLMALLASETGARAGELPAIHKDDVDLEHGYLHIHSQQVKVGKELIEIPYTKDERLNPHNGRFLPLTPKGIYYIRKALEIPGDSEYLFHDPYKSEWVKRDGYLLNLRRRCQKLGCKATNNHAFRMHFNSKLIGLGFEADDRALLMGHEVETNEKFYSLTDRRHLEDIKNRLNAAS